MMTNKAEGVAAPAATPEHSIGWSGFSSTKLFAEEDAGLGIVVKSWYLFISAAPVEGNCGGHFGTAVEVNPVEAAEAGVGFSSLHQPAGEAVAAEF